MGKEVDQRVVEMRFDNKQFEQNVKTSMSTLDKLKQALHLDGASKGLDNVGKAAKNVDMMPLSRAVETVRVKFSALEVMGVTALANITNSAINAGKQMAKSLSLDQITAGYSKYEQETANVQTLMNSTGKSVDEINGYLEKLMWFSDETSYGFTDMTAALSSMVSSGGDIEKLIPMIEGMATATAYAGKGAAEFSRVIYNLNQSYGKGYLDLTDWKSVELAGASSKQLKELIIETAKELGTLNKKSETFNKGYTVNTATFAQTLSEKWATSEVMEKAFTKFSEYAVAVQEAVARGDYDSTAEAMDALAGKYDKLAVKAFEASQKAKTFTEAIDATKDAASSEWKKIWKSIFGDYEQAAELWTDISGDLWDIFVGPLEGLRNTVSGAFSSNWDKIKKQVASAGVPIEDFKNKLIDLGKKSGVITDKMIEDAGGFEKSLKSGWLSGNLISKALMSYTSSAKTATAATKNLEKVVRDVRRGNYGNGAARVQALTKAGYDYKTVQDLVNKAIKGQTIDYNKLSDAQMKSLGFTKEQIEAIRELAKQAEETGTPLNELIASMEKPSGRELLIDTIRNALNGLRGVVLAAQNAFEGLSSSGLYSFLEKLNELSKKLILVDDETGELNEKGEKLSRTFGGLASIARMFGKLIKGTISVAIRVLSKLFGGCSTSILDATASVGDAIVAFEKWIDSNETLKSIINFVTLALEKVASVIHDVVLKAVEFLTDAFVISKDYVSKWIEEFKKSEICSKIINGIKTAFESLSGILSKSWNKIKNAKLSEFLKTVWNWLGKVVDKVKELVGKLKETEMYARFIEKATEIFEKFKEVASNIWEGLKNGLNSGSEGLFGVVRNIVDKILEVAKDRLGIHSPSTEFFEIGKNCILGLINGIIDTAVGLFKTVVDAVVRMVDIITERINVAKVIAIGSAGAIIYSFKRILDIAENVSKGFAAIGSMASAVNGLINDVKITITELKQSLTWKIKTKVILDVAKAIALLAASVWLLAQLELAQLGQAIGAIIILAGVIAVMAKILTSKAFRELNEEKIKNIQIVTKLLYSMVEAMAILALVSKMFAKMTWPEYGAAAAGIGLLVGAIGILIALTWITPKKDISKLSNLLLSIAGAMAILALVSKMFAKMTWPEYGAAAAGIGLLVGAIGILIALTWITPKKDISKLSNLLLSIAGAMAILALVSKMFAKMTWPEYGAAAAGIGLLVGAIGILIALTWITPEKDISKLSNLLLSIAGAMAILALVSKMFAKMNPDAFEMAAGGLLMLVLVVTIMIEITHLIPEKQVQNISVILLSIAGSMLILALVSKVMASISYDEFEMASGGMTMLVMAVAVLLMIMRLAPEKDMAKISATMMAIATCMAILAAIAVVLGFIPLPNLAQGVIALGILEAITALLMSQAKSLDKKSIASLIIVAVIIAELAAALFVLSKLNTEALQATAISLSGVMLVIALTMTAFSKIKLDVTTMVLSIAFILAIAAALTILAPALQKLGSMSWGGIIKSLVAIVGVFAVMGVAAAILSPLAPIILLLSISVMALGAALLFAGVGVTTFSSGLMLLSKIGPAALNSIVLVITTIISLIPVFVRAIGEGFIELLKVLADAGPVFIDLIVTMITSICDAIITCIPKIGETLIVVVKTVCEVLLTCVPMIIKTGFALFISFLRGIRDNIGEVVETAAEIIVNFINGIANKIPELQESGFNLIISYINGLADAIRNNAERIYDAAKNLITSLFDSLKTIVKKSGEDFKELGGNIIDGVKDGVKKSLSKVKDIATNIGNKLLGGVKDVLGIHSPSTEFAKIGKYSSEGLVSGLEKYSGAVVNAAKKGSSSAMDAMINGFKGLSSLFEDAINGEPTIRPVLDLSNIESGVKNINGMFGSKQSIALATSGTIGIQNGNSAPVINMTINGAPGQDVNQLADLVSERINNSVQRRNNTWR